MAKKAIIVDLDKCTGCNSCSVACKQENDINMGINYNTVKTIGAIGKFPNLEMYYLPVYCQQCESPECIGVCPTGASYRRKDGVVLIDSTKCIACKACLPACPYEVRTFDKKRNAVEKCTLCVQLTDTGGLPACVKICTGKARIYGNLDEANSEVSQALQKSAKYAHSLVDVGNKPLSRYILKKFQWINGNKKTK